MKAVPAWEHSLESNQCIRSLSTSLVRQVLYLQRAAELPLDLPCSAHQICAY